MANNVQIPAPFDTWYTIKEATEAMEYKHSQYVRKLLHEGKLGDYVQVATDANGTPQTDANGAYVIESGHRIKILVGSTEQWRIDPAACAEYKARAAQGGSTFGQHPVRRMLLRFSTDLFTVEQFLEWIAEAAGPSRSDDGELRWELTKAWQGGSKKSKKAKTPETVVATIVSSLTSAEDDDDDDDDYDDDDYDDYDDESDDVEDDEELDDILA